MGKTKRHEQTEGRRFKTLKGRNSKRRSGRGISKAILSKMVRFSNRERGQIPNKTTQKAMEVNDTEQEPMNFLGFDTVKEMLEEVNDTEQEGEWDET